MSGAIEPRHVRQTAGAGVKMGEVIETMRRDWMLYAMLAPALIWFLIFMYKPMYGLQIASNASAPSRASKAVSGSASRTS